MMAMPPLPSIASPDTRGDNPPLGRTIERFLDRTPSVRPVVEEMLARAAELRQAKAAAYPERGLPGPDRGSAFATAWSELERGAERLEALAALVRQGEGPAGEEVATAVGEALAALARLKVLGHAFTPPRKSASREALRALVAARGRFNEAFKRMERALYAAHVRKMPWQLEVASHIDPSAPMTALEITGYELSDTPAARKPWGERCFLTGSPFHTDSIAEPTLRYRSLDAVAHLLTPEAYELCQRLRAALERLAGIAPESVDEAAGLMPFLFEDYALEKSHPAFARLGLLDFPSLAVALNNMLTVYAEHPLFGGRAATGDWSRLGAGDRVAVAGGGGETGYTWESFGSVRKKVLRLAYSLERMGVERGEPVGVLALDNCTEFYLTEMACVMSRLVVVGFPQDAEQMTEVATQTGLRTLVAPRGALPRLRASGLLGAESSIERIVAYGSPAVEEKTGGEGVDSIAFETLVGEEIEERALEEDWRSASGVTFSTGVLYDDDEGHATAAQQGIAEDDAEEVYTLLFTSGSTGKPKGTILSRRRWAEEMCLRADVWPHVAVSFQPSALTADRSTVWRALYNGGRVGFARRGAPFFQDVRAIRPTLFDVPPVIWNTIYSRYRQALAEESESRAAIRRRFRGFLGGRLSMMGAGGAAPDPGVSRTMESIFGIPMLEGYGTTEVGFIAMNGKLFPGLDYRLIDRPELGLLASDRPHPRGELAVRTPRASSQYFLDQESSSEAFTDDGYFLTGDLVELLPGERIKILGRRKLFFKLAGAEFISPEPLERAYGRSECVDAVLVTGLPTESQVAAVVVPTDDSLGEAELLEELRQIARRQGLRACDTPAAVVVAPRQNGELPWTPANGLLTASYKLNRRALEERYRADVEAAYAKTAAQSTAFTEQAEGSVTTVDRLCRAVAGALAVDSKGVDMSASFADNGGTSLSAIELALRLEEVFGGKEGGGWDPMRDHPLEDIVSIPLDALATRLDARLEALAANDKKLAARQAPGVSKDGASNDQAPKTAAEKTSAAPAAGAPGPEEEAKAVAELAEADSHFAHAVAAALPMATSEHVLVTGATGLLGAHLIDHLDRTLPESARIYALIRAADSQAAAERWLKTQERFVLGRGESSASGSGRVVAVAGHLDRPQLGLEAADWQRLSSEVGFIYHSGAAVDHFAGYRPLRDANVGGTQQILQLAATTSLKGLHFVSSLNVAMILGQLGHRAVYEELPLPRPISPQTVRRNLGYAVTKLVAERLVESAFEQLGESFRVSVSRPAFISWSTETGCNNADDWVCRLLSSCLLLRQVPGAEEVGVPHWIAETETSARGLDMVPVDYVAAAIARLGSLTARGELPPPTRPGGKVPTFHVASTAPGEGGLVTVNRLIDLLTLADLVTDHSVAGLRSLPMSRWLLETEAEGAPFLPFAKRLSQSPPAMARSQTRRFEAAMAAQLSCPSIDEDAMRRYVNRYYLEQRLTSAAASTTGLDPEGRER